MNNIVATGKTGTIGRHLPTSVSELDLDLNSQNEYLKSWNRENQISLIHLAGIVGPAAVSKDLDLSFRINVSGTLRLAKEFLSKSSGNFYFVSTSHVYEKSYLPLNENSKIQPKSHYAEQKIQTEQMLKQLFSDEPTRLCIIRVFSVLDWNTPEFTLGGAIRKLRDNSNYILQNGDDVRDFLDPLTIATGIYKIAQEGALSGVVNLCSGTGISIRNAAGIMLAQAEIDASARQIRSGNSENPVIIGDNHKLKSIHPDIDLIWKPKF